MRRPLTVVTLAAVLGAGALGGCTPRYERMVTVTPGGYGTARPEVVLSFEGENMPGELRHLEDFRVYRSEPRLTGPRTWTAEPESRLSPTEVPATVRGQQLVLDVDEVPDGVHELWAQWGDTTTQNNTTLVVDHRPPTLVLDPPVRRGDVWEVRASVAAGEARGEVTTALEHLTSPGALDEGATGEVVLLVRPDGPEQAVTVTDRGGNTTRVTVSLPWPG